MCIRDRDIDERAKINTSRSVAAMIAIGVLNIITVPLLSKFGSHSAKTGSVSYTHLALSLISVLRFLR